MANSLITALLSIPKFGNGIGLHRMNYLTRELQKTDWWEKTQPINIVGTDGKGSTATLIESIFDELKINTGKYTSPHLFDFTERIRVNTEDIMAEDILLIYQKIQLEMSTFLEKNSAEQFGAFEVFTSIALHYFHQKRIDVPILEAGIGGRYDPTRICTGDFTALTSISLEHTELLGNSLELIAYDKIDIAPAESTVVVGVMENLLLERIKAYAQLKKVKILPISDHCTIQKCEMTVDEMTVDLVVDGLNFQDLKCKLVGPHQLSNLQIAILVSKLWVEKFRPNITPKTFRNAVYQASRTVKWKGRFEKISTDPIIYIDIGHTPNALREVTSFYKVIRERPTILILGVSYNRDISEIAAVAYPIADVIICTTSHHRGEKIEAVKASVDTLNQRNLPVYKKNSIESAVDLAQKMALEQDMEIIILGSLFLAIEANAYLEGKDPRDMHFF
jgi:dihydrofolate synthase/folylpolyglutamate synthase